MAGQNHEGYGGGPPQHQQQHPQHRAMADDRERKLPRPIGTERAMTRRTPGPPQPVGFAPTDIGLWGYHGAPGPEMGPGGGGGGPNVPMNPATLPPGLNHNDWMTLSGLHAPNVSVPAPNASDDGGLSYLQQKQQVHHHQQHHHHAQMHQPTTTNHAPTHHHHPCTNPCTAQLALQPKTHFNPTYPRGISYP